MKLVNLVEDTCGSEGLPVEHGLCFYIETGKHRILADTGASDLFVHNAGKKGIDLSAVDIVILSHGHYDHGGGLKYIPDLCPEAKIYMQKTAEGKYYSHHVKQDRPKYIGLSGTETLADVIRTDGDHQIDDELYLLTCPEDVSFPPANKDILQEKDGLLVPDNFVHEQFLVIRENEHMYLISGCAHHGIVNIMERFRKVFGRDPDIVVSGFHLVSKNGYTAEDLSGIDEIARELRMYRSLFYTCHCTGTEPYERMKKIMNEQLLYIHCGDMIETDN